MYVIQRKKTRGTRVTFSICEDATPGTWSHQLLIEQYRRLDEDWITGEDGRPPAKFKQLAFNTAFLEAVLRQNGELHCEYCGKPGLKIYDWRKGFNKIDGATTDHFLCKDRHPWLAFTIENLHVACSRCNVNKGNKDWPKSSIKFPYPPLKFFDRAKFRY